MPADGVRCEICCSREDPADQIALVENHSFDIVCRHVVLVLVRETCPSVPTRLSTCACVVVGRRGYIFLSRKCLQLDITCL